MPTPTPPPTPGPTVERFDAVTTSAYWGPPPAPRLFGDTFVMELWRDRGELLVHNTRMTIATTSSCCVLAEKHPSTGSSYRLFLDFGRGEWRLEGDAQATGTMTRR